MLSRARLGRALLARQGLLARTKASPLEMIEKLVGIQSQAPQSAFTALWSRIEGFVPDQLDALLLDRQVVRLTMMRSTVHLVSAADCRALRPVLTPAVVKAFLIGRKPENLQIDQVERRTAEIMTDGPVPAAVLASELHSRFPDQLPADLLFAAHCTTPLVQVPPRGLFKRSGQPINTPASTWLGVPLDDDDGPDELIRRYLRAFGPATVADIQAWSGLQGLRSHVERLRPELRSFTNERGQELVDVPDGLLPDEQTPAPVRIVAEFDNLVLAHADRTRIIEDAHRRQVITINGQVRSTFLVDGRVAGMCKVRRKARVATLTITPFITLTKPVTRDLMSEAEHLLRFAEPDAQDHQIDVEG